ncbi:metallophosphoesterase [Candidatus Palauibacter sp.]|uniref:metallophosphoesterase n=1 Tax=Candidatus Palauibacter sp. TaxID=3101350 RepID=UPI003B525664
MPGWPEGEETRIALIADLHVGSPRNGRDNLRRVVRRVNETRPDLVLIAGDLTIDNVMGGRFVPPEEIAEDLAALDARHGVFAVLGNHDRWLSAERVEEALSGVGITVLDNRGQRARVRGNDIWIAGVADFWTGHPSVADALDGVRPGEPVIVVTHNPDIFPEVPPRASLTLAGHTHGGQVIIPFVGPGITPSRFGDRYAAGHVVEDGRHLFVTTGVGTSRLGVRFLVPPEVVSLQLTRCESCESPPE